MAMASLPCCRATGTSEGGPSSGGRWANPLRSRRSSSSSSAIRSKAHLEAALSARHSSSSSSSARAAHAALEACMRATAEERTIWMHAAAALSMSLSTDWRRRAAFAAARTCNGCQRLAATYRRSASFLSPAASHCMPSSSSRQHAHHAARGNATAAAAETASGESSASVAVSKSVAVGDAVTGCATMPSLGSAAAVVSAVAAVAETALGGVVAGAAAMTSAAPHACTPSPPASLAFAAAAAAAIAMQRQPLGGPCHRHRCRQRLLLLLLFLLLLFLLLLLLLLTPSSKGASTRTHYFVPAPGQCLCRSSPSATSCRYGTLRTRGQPFPNLSPGGSARRAALLVMRIEPLSCSLGSILHRLMEPREHLQ
mmetsp:Transcript_56481/g.112128  ORF Transcript_56481/g.112128 Transcript_56481/m.112128 type:complete len:369 (+) Transcript_56481:596-1702(+)